METFSSLLAICARNSPVPVNSPHKGQWHRALIFSLICIWINDWVNNREAGDFRCYHAHYDVTLMPITWWTKKTFDALQIVSWKCQNFTKIFLSFSTKRCCFSLIKVDIGISLTKSLVSLIKWGLWCIKDLGLHQFWQLKTYCKISNIWCTKSQNLNDSQLILQLSLCSILK